MSATSRSQERTNAAAKTVDAEGRSLTASAYGTAVHMNVKKQIDALADPNFVAERSFLKEKEEVSYGEKGSIRIDVYENAGNSTVCVYDIKTGGALLSLPRSMEMAGHVFARYHGTQRIIVTQVKPPG